MNKLFILCLAAVFLAACSKDEKQISKLVDQADLPEENSSEDIPTDPQALFLYENAQEPDIIVRPSGLQIRVIKRGTGKIPAPESNVTANYHGTLIDGTVFDSTRKTGTPLTFPLSGVIDGWQEGLLLMQEGAIYQFFIPANLGYGEAGAGTTIPPGATLIFEVELVNVQFPLDPNGEGQQ